MMPVRRVLAVVADVAPALVRESRLPVHVSLEFGTVCDIRGVLHESPSPAAPMNSDVQALLAVSSCPHCTGRS